MSVAIVDLPSFTFEAFLDAEAAEQYGVRSEWVGGQVYAMSGGSERHDLAAGLLYRLLAPSALSEGCRPFTHNRLLRTEHAAYYPDVMVVCGPAAHRLYETDAGVIAEVRSPGTTDLDRREKAGVYSGLAGLQAYVLVDPDERVFDVATPVVGGGLTWRRYTDGAVVVLAGTSIDLRSFYDQIDRTATT